MIILFSPLFTQDEELETRLERAMSLIDRIEEHGEGITEEEVEAAIVDFEEMMFQASEIFHIDSILNFN